jgi:hypothetical protein
MVMQRESPRALVLKPSGKKSGAHAPHRIFVLDNAFDLIDGSVILALETGCWDRAQCHFVTLDQIEILFISAGQIDLVVAHSGKRGLLRCIVFGINSQESVGGVHGYLCSRSYVGQADQKSVAGAGRVLGVGYQTCQ